MRIVNQDNIIKFIEYKHIKSLKKAALVMICANVGIYAMSLVYNLAACSAYVQGFGIFTGIVTLIGLYNAFKSSVCDTDYNLIIGIAGCSSSFILLCMSLSVITDSKYCSIYILQIIVCIYILYWVYVLKSTMKKIDEDFYSIQKTEFNKQLSPTTIGWASVAIVKILGDMLSSEISICVNFLLVYICALYFVNLHIFIIKYYFLIRLNRKEI